METYESLLEKAYKKVKVVSTSSNRFELPQVKGQVQGKNTVITNMQEISDYLRRPIEQISKFLQKELASAGKIDSGRLILNTKLNSAKVNEKLEMYTKLFVLCPVCGKPDTEILSEKSIKVKHCLACGAKSPIKYHF